MKRSGPYRLIVMAGILACVPAPRPSDTELYAMVVEAVGEAVGAASPIRVHPRLMQRPRAGETLDQGTYNAFDTATVVGVVRRHAGLELCSTNTVGSCVAPEGGLAIVLSEMQELGVNGVGVGALVMDGRAGRVPQRYATVRVKPTSRRWEVMDVRWTR